MRKLLTQNGQKGRAEDGQQQIGTRTFRPAVSRKASVKAESDSFAQRIFGGATKPLIKHFAQNSRLTAEEVEEIKAEMTWIEKQCSVLVESFDRIDRHLKRNGF